MATYKVSYNVKGISGTAETVISCFSSNTARDMVINQNGGKDKVSIRFVTEIRK